VNVFDTIYRLRPEVDPIRLADRRHIRESLFGVGHDDVNRSVRSRLDNGAVVSTAAPGTRATASSASRKFAPVLRALAGLAIAGGIGFAAWTFLLADDSESVASPSTVVTAPPTTRAITPTTAPPEVRTPVTATAPLLINDQQVSVDEVSITPPPPGSSSLLLRMPDDSVMWISDFDGDAVAPNDLDVSQVGSIQVGAARNLPAEAGAAYRIITPCGSLIANDAPGADLLRPPTRTLFESMTLSDGGALDASLPEGFSVIDVGQWQTTYTADFQVPTDDGTASARLTQIPNGSLAQLAFGGRQLAPETFLDGPAFIDSAPSQAGLTSIFWTDAGTVFNISSTEIGAPELAAFVDSLVATDATEWSEQFATPAPPAPALSSDCQPQPSLAPNLNP
jgi:hypothetical protein